MEDMELEGLLDTDEGFQPLKEELRIDTQCSSWQRLHYLMKNSSLPLQIWKIFTAAFAKVRQIFEVLKGIGAGKGLRNLNF